VLADAFGVEHRDVGGAVEERRLLFRVDREAELPARARVGAVLAHIPAAIELVVAVDREATLEADQQRLAARLDGIDALARELLFVALQVRVGEGELECRAPH
jgi:hypothetical protein